MKHATHKNILHFADQSPRGYRDMVTDQVFRPMSWVLQIVTIVRKDAKTKEYNIPSFAM